MRGRTFVSRAARATMRAESKKTRYENSLGEKDFDVFLSCGIIDQAFGTVKNSSRTSE